MKMLGRTFQLWLFKCRKRMLKCARRRVSKRGVDAIIDNIREQENIWNVYRRARAVGVVNKLW